MGTPTLERPTYKHRPPTKKLKSIHDRLGVQTLTSSEIKKIPHLPNNTSLVDVTSNIRTSSPRPILTPLKRVESYPFSNKRFSRGTLANKSYYGNNDRW